MQDEVNQGKSVALVLPPAEALVLFDLLSRWEETESACVQLEHQAEYWVLWNIVAALESSLAEPLMPDYQFWLDHARELVRDKEG